LSRKVGIHEVWLTDSVDRVFHGRGVYNTDNVSRSWGLNNGIERTGSSILKVDFHNLLVVVRSLKELNSGVKRTPISLEHDLNTLHVGVERSGVNSSSLYDASLGGTGKGTSRATLSIVSNNVGINTGSKREFHVSSVTDADGVGSTWGLDDGTEGTVRSILNVDIDALRSVVRSLPQLNVGVKGTSLGLQENLNSLHRLIEGASTERASLDGDRGRLFPDLGGTLVSRAGSLSLGIVGPSGAGALQSRRGGQRSLNISVQVGGNVSVDASNVRSSIECSLGVESGLLNNKTVDGRESSESQECTVDLHFVKFDIL
jgi:hypothetical protein